MNAWQLGDTTEALQKKLAELTKEVTEIKDELLRREELAPEYRLAEELHNVLCSINHTDGCGWFYEVSNGVPNWHGWAHARYLEKARKLLVEVNSDPKEVMRIVTAIRT